MMCVVRYSIRRRYKYSIMMYDCKYARSFVVFAAVVAFMVIVVVVA